MRISTISNLNFNAGRVYLYSDFDGTYSPVSHASLHNPEKNKHMPEYCSRMDKFFKSTEKDLDFHVTTGRTFGEYKAVSELLKERDFKLPLPKSFISKNGSDEFVKVTSEDFYTTKGQFPYIYALSDSRKEADIKDLTNWDGQGLNKKIKETAKKYGIRLIEADSENSVKDYGSNSLYSFMKLDPDEWKKLDLKNKNTTAEMVIGSRNDGNLKVYLTFPPDYEVNPKRTKLYNDFINDIKTFLKEEKVDYHMSSHDAEKKNFYRKTCSITPQFENGKLTKLYDTKKAYERAVKNNDLLIVAGNGSNDFKMLNPLEYFDKEFLNKCKNKSVENKDFYNLKNKHKVDKLKAVLSNDMTPEVVSLRNELNSNGFIEKLESMPICSIVVKDNDSSLKPLVKTFSSIGKVIEVEQGELDKGAKQAIKKYAEKNESFSAKISSGLKSLVSDTKQIDKKSSHKTYWALGALCFAVTYWCLLYTKLKLKETNKLENP